SSKRKASSAASVAAPPPPSPCDSPPATSTKASSSSPSCRTPASATSRRRCSRHNKLAFEGRTGTAGLHNPVKGEGGRRIACPRLSHRRLRFRPVHLTQQW